MIFGVYSIDDLVTGNTGNSATSVNLSPNLGIFLLACFLFFVVIILLSFLISSMTYLMQALTAHGRSMNTFNMINLILEQEQYDIQESGERNDMWIQVLKRNVHHD
jgi:hypothetical protein